MTIDEPTSNESQPMTALKMSASTSKQRVPRKSRTRVAKKLFLASPFRVKWPVLDDNSRAKLVQWMCCSSSEKDFRKRVVLGLNAVTRALEQDQLSGVLLDVGADPAKLLHGIIRLARSRKTPVACVKSLKELVQGAQVSSLLALGLRPDPRCAPVVAIIDDGGGDASVPQLEPNPAKCGPVAPRRRANVPRPPAPNLQLMYTPRVAPRVSALPQMTLVAEKALGFPSYHVSDLPIRTPVSQHLNRASKGASAAGTRSDYVNANVKQVFSRGDTKVKRRRRR